MTYHVGASLSSAPMTQERINAQAIDKFKQDWPRFKNEFVKWIAANKPGVTDRIINWGASGGLIDNTATFNANLARWEAVAAKVMAGDVSMAKTLSTSMIGMNEMFKIPPTSVTGLAWQSVIDTLKQLKQVLPESSNTLVKVAGAALVLAVAWKIFWR